jgi:hypothetical protein
MRGLIALFALSACAPVDLGVDPFAPSDGITAGSPGDGDGAEPGGPTDPSDGSDGSTDGGDGSDGSDGGGDGGDGSDGSSTDPDYAGSYAGTYTYRFSYPDYDGYAWDCEGRGSATISAAGDLSASGICTLDFGDGVLDVEVVMAGRVDSAGAITGSTEVVFYSGRSVYFEESFNYISAGSTDGSRTYLKLYGEKDYTDREGTYTIGFLAEINATR